jgi:hypothetical protein
VGSGRESRNAEETFVIAYVASMHLSG